MGCAIFILTVNNPVRKTYLKTCLYFLFKNFNAKYKYPVVIFHEGDYDNAAVNEVLAGIRQECRHLVRFHTVDPYDFTIPDNIDRERFASVLDIKPTPYWRDEKYRMMCRWWMIHMPKYAEGYDYVMRLDDDSIIEEPIDNDLFDYCKERDLVYASNIIHIDCGICCYGMKQFFERLDFVKDNEEKKAEITRLFQRTEVPWNSFQYNKVRSLLAINNESVPENQKAPIELWMPMMYYNNFHITRPSFWKEERVQEILREIDNNGGIFYYRWGDAPLQTLVAIIVGGADKVTKIGFRYSKRMQREAFKGDDDKYYSYMPGLYCQSSCVTEKS